MPYKDKAPFTEKDRKITCLTKKNYRIPEEENRMTGTHAISEEKDPSNMRKTGRPYLPEHD
jgi:hypothetical protein